MRQLGIDPDLHTTGFAIVKDLKVLRVGIVSVALDIKGSDAVLAMARALAFATKDLAFLLMSVPVVVVEGQEIYFGKTKKPESILHLGQVAGAAISAFLPYCPDADFFLPKPKEWKGNVPKHIHQARVLDKLGIPFYKIGGQNKYCVPETDAAAKIPGGSALKPSDWKHVVDAIGLAIWTR